MFIQLSGRDSLSSHKAWPNGKVGDLNKTDGGEKRKKEKKTKNKKASLQSSRESKKICNQMKRNRVHTRMVFYTNSQQTFS
jgi:hypothetical protein